MPVFKAIPTGAIVGDTDTQTLTNKTLTTPTISSPTLSGTFNIPGTTTNNSASAGNVGEYVSSSVLLGSPVALVSGTAKTITSISLTAGDWEISAQVGFTGGATTTVTILRAQISTADNTEDTTNGFGSSNVYTANTVFNSDNPIWTVGPNRVSLSGTTTYYLIARAFFAISTCSGFGIIHARRVR